MYGRVLFKASLNMRKLLAGFSQLILNEKAARGAALECEKTILKVIVE